MRKARFSMVILAVVALLAFAGTALAAESWVTDPKTGAKIGWDSPSMTLTSASWSGPVTDGKAEGKGTLAIATTNTLTGETSTGQLEAEMTAGKLNGKVRGKWSNGDTFDGNYTDGRTDGKGVYRWTTSRNGRFYEGEFKNGLQDGQGVYKEANGKVIYEGQWKDGTPATRPNLDKVLGIPWGATQDEVKKVMQERPNTSLRYAWREGSRNVQQYLGPFNDRSHWIFFWFNEGKLYAVAAHVSAPEAQVDRVMEALETTRKGMTERYGPADTDTGKYLDTKLYWFWPGKYRITLSIERQSAPEPGFGMWLRYADVAALYKAEGTKASAAKNDF
ncbi:MAG: hypothetical protein RIN56_03545 [Sporomusaceae bacterium]|nr:hypothetical protein [Sporomusaceae bacterium]